MRRVWAIGGIAAAALAIGDGGAAADVSPVPTAAPASGAELPPIREHADPVASYTLRAKLDAQKHTVSGEGTITWKNASKAAVSELWMHLYLNGFKNQSSVFMRSQIGGFRGSGLPREWGTIDLTRLVLITGSERQDLKASIELKRPGDDDETDARIPLPRAVPSGATITLEVAWEDKLPTIVERTGYWGSFHMVAQWFPKLARLEEDGTWAHFPFHHLGEFYADFGKYDVTLDVPEGFVVGATGPAVETRREGGRLIERHVQDDIHEFAWTAWDKFTTRKERIEGIDVTVLTPPHYEGHAERELETLRFAIPHYRKHYGPYPYPVLTVVHPPASAQEAGGMEYPTLITTGTPAYVPRGVHFLEAVTIHEFGHQYFYGMLASNEDAWPFMDEGVNQWAEGKAMTAWKGSGSGLDFAWLKVGEFEAQAYRSRTYAHDEPIAQGAGTFTTGNTYGALVYSRTAALLETIARVYGPEKVDRAMTLYTRRFRFEHPKPPDLIEAFRTEVGEGAAENLKLALFDKGWVDYAITLISQRGTRAPVGVFDRGGKRETVTSETASRSGREGASVLVLRRGTLRFPVEIELVAEDGSRSRVTWDGAGDSFRAPYAGASPLRAAIVDPDNRVFVDDHPENNHRTASGHKPSGAPRTLERATYWAATLLGGLGL